MKVTVNFGNVRVIVPCGNGNILVRDLMNLAVTRYKKATSKPSDSWVTIHNLKSSSDGGILDPDDKLNDVADDREQIIAIFEEQTSPFFYHNGGDGTSASSVGTESPDIFQNDLNRSSYPKASYSCNDVEITEDLIHSGNSSLQVRRGSEPALNRLSPVCIVPDPTKRWSAAVVLDDDVPKISVPSHDDSLDKTDDEGPPGERGEGSGEEKPTFPIFARGSGRLSILGNNPEMYRWAEAADRQLFKFHSNRAEPVGTSDSSPQEPSPTQHQNQNAEKKSVITLKNEAGPLGIHVLPKDGLSGRDCGLVIKDIEPGSRIDRDGRLQKGDRIVEINGRSIVHVSFQEAQDIFKEALQAPEIQLCYVHSDNRGEFVTPKKAPPPPVFPKPSSSSVKKPMIQPPQQHELEADNILVEGEERAGGLSTKVATVTPTKKVPQTTSRNLNSALTSNTRKIGKKILIQLTKGPDGLGFSITTRDNPAGGNCPIYIKNILPKGAAVKDGRLKHGDRLLEVNGIEMTGLSQVEAVTILRNTPLGGTVDLVVSRQEPDPSPSPSQPRELPAEQAGDGVGLFPWKHREVLTFEIPLNDTGSAGLGVSVKGKTSTTANGSTDLGIFVKSVIHGGAASKDGRLRTNDQLVNINGISLLGMTNMQAMETLRRAMTQGEGPTALPNAITLTVARRIPSPSHARDGSANVSSDDHLFSSSGESDHRRNDSTISSDSQGASSEDLLVADTGKSESDLATPDNSASENSGNTVIFQPRKASEEVAKGSSVSVQPTRGRHPVIARLTGQSPERKSRTNSPQRNSDEVDSRGPESVMIDDKYVGVAGSQMELAAGRNVGSEEDLRDKKDDGEKGAELLPKESEISASQLTLDPEEPNFQRDGFGRQSMSEKRHTQLDPRNTDTYQRNKKAREEREKHKHTVHTDEIIVAATDTTQVKEVAAASGDESHTLLQDATTNESAVASHVSGDSSSKETPPQVGPSLGMRKSSSLESLQTMVQEIQKERNEAALFAPRQSVRMPRHRGCNESFRAAVDRSYEAPMAETMETLEEESESGRSVSPSGQYETQPLTMPVRQQQPPTVLGTTTLLSNVLHPPEKENKAHKKKGGIFKGLGSVFKFGKTRKNTSESVNKSKEELDQEAERQRARKAAQEEQSRIQEHYRKLLEQQQQQQQLQQQQQQPMMNTYGSSYPPSSMGFVHHPAASTLTYNQNAVPQQQQQQHSGSSRQERMQQLRAQHQRRHQERHGHYPRDEQEEKYEQEIKEMDKQKQQHQHRESSEGTHSRSHSVDIYKEMERPGSRVGIAGDPSRYSHYVNYKEIQQHLKQFQQKSDLQREACHRRSQMDAATYATTHRSRPISNFYEYESLSVQRLHQQQQQQAAETNSNSLPRHGGGARSDNNDSAMKTKPTTHPHGHLGYPGSLYQQRHTQKVNGFEQCYTNVKPSSATFRTDFHSTAPPHSSSSSSSARQKNVIPGSKV